MIVAAKKNKPLSEPSVKKSRRPQSLGEEIGNAITHGLGAVFGIVAIILMAIHADGGVELMSALFFSIGIFLLYSMSCLYHAFKNDTKVKRLFRIFDHSAIYLLIGGTYAPVLIVAVGGVYGWILFFIQWAIIITLITLKAIMPGKNTKLLVILSLLLGWSGLMFMPLIHSVSAPLFWLILSGGLAYSVGVIFFASKFKYAHFVWHFFVLFGTTLHFIGIFTFIIL